MKANIPYETAEERGVFLELEIPDKNILKTFVPREPGAMKDIVGGVLKAVDAPVAGPSFSELVGPGQESRVRHREPVQSGSR